VICAGGGGIPVARDTAGKWRGVEAVIDKDSSAALLAEEVGADLLILLTDVPAVYLDYGTPAQTALREATPQELLAHGFAAGSMGPKVRAACGFVQSTGRRAAIGRLEDAVAIAAGMAGTLVRR
jgi:carbamate kinase